jgi:hypothetical protein
MRKEAGRLHVDSHRENKPSSVSDGDYSLISNVPARCTAQHRQWKMQTKR